MFTLTNRGKRVFPQKTHLLFTILAELIEKKYGSQELQEMLSKIGMELAETLKPSEDIEGDERFEKIVDEMERFGFYPKIEKKNGEFEIKYRNCVFENGKEKLGEELCKIHREITRNLFPDMDVEIESKTEKEGNVCTHKISSK